MLKGGRRILHQRRIGQEGPEKDWRIRYRTFGPKVIASKDRDGIKERLFKSE